MLSHLVIREEKDPPPSKVGVAAGIQPFEKLIRGLDHVVVGNWDRFFRILYLDRLDVLIAFDGIKRTQEGRPHADRLRIFRPRSWRAPLYHHLNRKHAGPVPRIRALLDADQRRNGPPAHPGPQRKRHPGRPIDAVAMDLAAVPG